MRKIYKQNILPAKISQSTVHDNLQALCGFNMFSNGQASVTIPYLSSELMMEMRNLSSSLRQGSPCGGSMPALCRDDAHATSFDTISDSVPPFWLVRLSSVWSCDSSSAFTSGCSAESALSTGGSWDSSSSVSSSASCNTGSSCCGVVSV